MSPVPQNVSRQTGPESDLRSTYLRMKADVDEAARIQRALLPRSSPVLPGVKVAWDLLPCDELAGDILNAFRLDDDHLGVFLVDVSGHGIAAAMLSIAVYKALTPLPCAPSLVFESRCGNDIVPPAEVFQKLNRLFPMDPDMGQYFTALYGILQASTGEFRFTSAGHNAPVYQSPDGTIRELDHPGFPIGIVEDGRYTESVVTLEPGGRIYLFSDGLTDTENNWHEPFGDENLERAIAGNWYRPLRASVTDILKRVMRWNALTHPVDDVSLVALELDARAHTAS